MRAADAYIEKADTEYIRSKINIDSYRRPHDTRREGLKMEDEAEARRVQFTGRSSYIVNLPKKWVVEQGIRQGDLVFIYPQADGSLLLYPRRQPRPEGRDEASIRVDPHTSPDSLVRHLVSLYVGGYDVMRVYSEEGVTLAQKEAVKEIVRTRLVGTEVVSESADGMVVQVLLSFPQLPIEDALRRMATIATYMLRDAYRAVETLDRDLANIVIRSDDEVDRFSLYVIRQLVGAVADRAVLKDVGLSSPSDCLGYRVVVKSLERIADHAARVAHASLGLEEGLGEGLLAQLGELKELTTRALEASMASLFKRDYAEAEGVFDVVAKCRGLESVILSRAAGGKGDGVSVKLIVEDIRRCSEYAADIAEIVMNMTVRASSS
jgi:phosphate uptake regulator